jgi:hypothetical protein
MQIRGAFSPPLPPAPSAADHSAAKQSPSHPLTERPSQFLLNAALQEQCRPFRSPLQE